MKLAPLRSHGAWGGADPLAGAAGPRRRADGARSRSSPARRSGRPGWSPFYRAIAAAGAPTCSRRPGLLASVGAGRVAGGPPGDVLALALGGRRAGLRVRPAPTIATSSGGRGTENWYSEELFARFRPYGSYGTWDGTDPLASG